MTNLEVFFPRPGYAFTVAKDYKSLLQIGNSIWI